MNKIPGDIVGNFIITKFLNFPFGHCSSVITCLLQNQIFLLRRQYSHNWKQQMRNHYERRKVIPNLVYLHNPWKYFITKVNLMKVRWFWDPEFVEEEFIRGAKKAAVVLTDTIRLQDSVKIGKLTTPLGYQQISRDMLLSRNDTRLKLARFQSEHLRRAIPMKVATRVNYGRKYCFIDMLFVGLRNTKDFDTPQEAVEIKQILDALDSDLKTPFEHVQHRIVFAEIFIRFRRDYTDIDNEFMIVNGRNQTDRSWSVAFYKILSFDILNYDPPAS